MTNPLHELIDTALELMNHSFAPPGDPAAARLEFYHQFRKLWDRGIPVGMGLGHLLLKVEGESLVVERIAEKGQPGQRLAIIAFNGSSDDDRLGIVHDGRRWCRALESASHRIA
jgi:hypothetical protein